VPLTQIAGNQRFRRASRRVTPDRMRLFGTLVPAAGPFCQIVTPTGVIRVDGRNEYTGGETKMVRRDKSETQTGFGKFLSYIPLVALLASCGTSPYAGQSPSTAASFSAIQSEILTPACGSCHSTEQARGGFSVSSYAEVMSSPGAVTPFQPGTSELYYQCYNAIMPRDGSPLSSSELESIYNWIAYGAPNN
jgi:hypothetical protein